MKKVILKSIGLVWVVVFCLTPLRPAVAQAKTTEQYKYTGQRGQSYTYGYDTSGCLFRLIYADALKGVIRRTGQRDTSSDVFISIYGYNVCTNEYLPSLFGEIDDLPDTALRFDPQLAWASLETSFMVYDYYGNSFPVHFKLDWKNMDVRDYRTSDHSQEVYPNVRFDSFEKRTRRLGSAYGSITLGADSYTLNPYPYCRGGGGCADLDNISAGALTITFSSDAAAWKTMGTAAGPNLSVLPTSTNSNATRHYSFNGQTASTWTSSLDPTGCILTSVDVFLTQGVVKEAGHSDKSILVSTELFGYNFCTDEFFPYANGSTDSPADATVLVDKKLDSASVKGIITVYDSAGNIFPVEVNLTWQGSGPILEHLRDRSHFQYTLAGEKYYTYSDWSERSANVSGTISFQGNRLTILPSSAYYNRLGLYKTGEIDIYYHKPNTQ